MVGWGLLLLLPDGIGVPGIIVMVVAELLVPVWAEQSTPTSWHPHHIAERFGLFTLIVLGESVAAAIIAIQGAADAGGAVGDLVDVAAGACSSSSRCGGRTSPSPSAPSSNGPGRRSTRARGAMRSSGGTAYVVFASAAAVGAGLAVAADQAIGRADLSARAATPASPCLRCTCSACGRST
jgi:hypothetical protein